MKVYIEANIGAGKSTLLKLLEKKGNTKVNYVQEPVDKWIETKDSTGTNILDYFYRNQQKWSFAFQMNSFISRTHSITENNNEITFGERSVFTDKFCFANNCYDSGMMSEMEFIIYNKWHQWLVDSFDLKPQAFIYLKTKPDTCIKRINERNRGEEDSIPIEYLEKLHQKHEEWMLETEVPVLVIDAEKNLYEESEINIVIDQINNFMEENFNTSIFK